MAQANSAQREPSMEEILASIRRIIEDGETGRKEPQEADAPIEENGGEVESFRAELKPVPEFKSASQADDSPPGETAFPETPQADPSQEDEKVEAELDAALNPANEGGDAWRPSWSERDSATSRQKQSPSDEEPPAQPFGMPDFLSDSNRPGGRERSAILSEVPGRKVAAAFDELNEALWESRRKRLDQMAEEMLRPMLQEWLDNNLPQMVERLVREEIERIARGDC